MAGNRSPVLFGAEQGKEREGSLAPERQPSRSFPCSARNNTGVRFPAIAQAPSNLSPLSSQRTQFLAIFQSRSTESLETFRNSAVSSRLSPPKKRSSTTWLFLGSP